MTAKTSLEIVKCIHQLCFSLNNDTPTVSFTDTRTADQ